MRAPIGSRIALQHSVPCTGSPERCAKEGFAQTIPTLFPFVELQSKLVARYVGGDYALPSPDEMEETIRRDQEIHNGAFTDRPRHTMQIDWYVYEHDIRTRELPAGLERARAGMAPQLAGRAERSGAKETATA